MISGQQAVALRVINPYSGNEEFVSSAQGGCRVPNGRHLRKGGPHAEAQRKSFETEWTELSIVNYLKQPFLHVFATGFFPIGIPSATGSGPYEYFQVFIINSFFLLAANARLGNSFSCTQLNVFTELKKQR